MTFGICLRDCLHVVVFTVFVAFSLSCQCSSPCIRGQHALSGGFGGKRLELMVPANK